MFDLYQPVFLGYNTIKNYNIKYRETLMRIIAATQNMNKLNEISHITKDFGMGLVSQKDVGLGYLDIEETGTTCEENSYIKAKTISDMTGEPAIADDSGLFVDALGGEPGVNSARYSGVHGDDAAARKIILKKLEGLPYKKRTAMFVCVITLVYPDGRVVQARGECKGHISYEEKGTGGFGYDSIFIPEGRRRTFAQMPQSYKDQNGHRGRALQRLRELL